MKNKKNMSGKSKLRRMIENKGFYIALFSLVAIMGFSVYARKIQLEKKNSGVAFDDAAWQEALSESGVEFKGNAAPPENSGDSANDNAQSNAANTPETAVPEKRVSDAEKKPEAPATAAKPKAVAAEQSVQTAAETAPQSPGKLSMQLPCPGKIIAGCSLDDLVYCGAMDDWRTHNGLDIAAAEGDPVKAAAAGTVSQVYEDDLLGVVVVIDHGDNIATLYGNLQNYDFIRTGTAVHAGDIIGGVGKPGALESDKGSHLHFEVQKNGEYQNPISFIGS